MRMFSPRWLVARPFAPEARAKIVRMLVALFLVRCLANIPLASQPLDVRHLFQSEPFLALIDIFAGGATARFSLLALGVYPYVVGRLATWMLCGEVLRELPSSWVERRVYICTALTATAMGSARSEERR